MNLLQVVPPDPSAFAAFDSLGVPAALGFMIFVLCYLLYRTERRAETDLARERERTDRVDAQADKMLDIQNQILARLNLADEKEKWRREGQ
jgi:hypothetical protein